MPSLLDPRLIYHVEKRVSSIEGQVNQTLGASHFREP